MIRKLEGSTNIAGNNNSLWKIITITILRISIVFQEIIKFVKIRFKTANKVLMITTLPETKSISKLKIGIRIMWPQISSLRISFLK